MNAQFTNKDVGTALGIPIGIVLVWILDMVFVYLGPGPSGSVMAVPAPVASAIGSISSFAVAYFIKERIRR